MVQVPFNGLADPRVECFFRRPAEVVVDLTGVDGVAEVVAGAILDVCDQDAIGAAVGSGAHFVQQVAEGMYHLDVLLLVMASDVVGLADLAFGNNPV